MLSTKEFLEMLQTKYPVFYDKNNKINGILECVKIEDIKNSDIDLLDQILPFYQNNDTKGFIDLLLKHEEAHGKLGSTITSILLGIKITMNSN